MFFGQRDGDAVDAGGANQFAVRRRLVEPEVIGVAQQRADVAEAADGIEAAVELAVLVVGHPEPDPRTENDDQATTDSAATMTMMRNDMTRISSR